MHGLMATGTPASPLAQPARAAMIRAADNNSRRCLLLEMTPETKIGIARHQHLLVHRSVRIVACRAALADGLMLKNEGPALGGMAFAARIAFGQQCRSASPNRRSF